jgi:hypothetical protein
MHVDCDTCAVKGRACSSCVVTVLLGSTPEGIEWDETEREALGVLADSGLIPPLRLVPERLVPLGLPRPRQAG